MFCDPFRQQIRLATWNAQTVATKEGLRDRRVAATSTNECFAEVRAHVAPCVACAVCFAIGTEPGSDPTFENGPVVVATQLN